MVESATSSGYAALTPEEVHHKMCKKIAQLTRVIFHLNSKNEDNERILRAHLSSYDKEVDALTVEYNERIKKSGQLIEESTKHEQALLAKLDETIVLTTKEKERASRRVANLEEEYSKSLKEKEEALENELGHVLTRVRKAQGDYEKHLASLTDALKESKDRYSRDLESTNKAHVEALQKLESQRTEDNAAVNKRFARMEEEHNTELRRIRDSHIKEMSEARETAEKNRVKAERRFKSELLDAKEESQKLQRELESTSVNLKEARESHEESQRRLREVEDELSQKADEVAEANRALGQLHGVIKDESLASAEMQENIERMKAESRRMQAMICQQESTLAQKDVEISELSQKLHGFQTEGNENRESLAAAMTEKLRLQEALTLLEAEKKREESRREEEFQSLKKGLEAEKERVKIIEEEWSRRLESTVTNYKAETVELRRGHKDELDALMAQHNEEKASLENAMEESRSQLEAYRKNTLETALQNEKEKYAIERAELTREYEGKLKLAEQKLLQERRDEKKIVDEVYVENQRLKTELERTKRGNEEAHLEIQGLEIRLQEYAAEIEREARKHQETVERHKRDFETELSRRLKEVEEKAAKTEQSASEKSEIQKKRSEMVLMEQEKRLKQLAAESTQVEHLNDELRVAQCELVREKQRSEEIIEATRKGEQERSKLLEGHLLERVTTLEQKLASEREQWQCQRDELLMEHQDELEKANDARKRDVDDAIAYEARRWREICEKEKDNFTQQLAQKQAKHDATMRCLKAENDSDIKALNEKLESVRKDMNLRVKQTEEAMRKKEGEMQEKLGEAKSALLMLDRKVDEQERTIVEKNSELARVSSHFAEEMATMRELSDKLINDHEKQLQTTANVHQEEIKNLTAENRQQILAREESLRRVESIREAEELRLKEKIDELVLMYENRPSREEDVSKISCLTEELKDLQKAYEQLKEQMKFYQLELINREKNYNKVFAANPTIGVYNPLKEPPPTASLGGNTRQAKRRDSNQSWKKPRESIEKRSATMDI